MVLVLGLLLFSQLMDKFVQWGWGVGCENEELYCCLLRWLR